MFALLQVYPAEAMADDYSDAQACLDIIAVGHSEGELARFLTDYAPRYLAACAAFDAWDADQSDEWGPEHDAKTAELEVEHQICGSLIRETEFKIVEILDGPFREFTARRPQLIRSA
jgi:hypothetical protein